MRKKLKLKLSQLSTSINLTATLAMLMWLFATLPIPATNSSVNAFPKQSVTGTVTSESDGLALPGVNIHVKGTIIGTTTDMAGEYTLEIDNTKAILVFSYVGFISQEIPVNGRKVINVQLVEETTSLDEVVVIGYGTQKKVNLSGAVDVVTSKAIENRPATNLVRALQGLSPNLNITVGNEGGEMGARMALNVRGIGSINGGSPYILVDGIEQDIYSLNPTDIQSISVLKDAAASAIYGARAAFGVILVTTKKGRNDGISVNYSTNYSFAKPTVLPKTANSIDFANYFNAASVNDGSPRLFQKIIIENMKKYQAGEIDYWSIPAPWAPQFWLSYSGGWANTDWYKVQYKDWVPNSLHNISVSGGDKRTQFYISGSTFDQKGLMRIGDDSYVRNNLNVKVNTKVYDWLRFNFSSKMNKTNINRPSYPKNDYYNFLSRHWPTNAPYYPDGSLAYENVQFYLQNGGRYDENQNELSVIPGIEIEPVKNWIIYANYRWKMNTLGGTNHEAKLLATLADGSNAYLRDVNNFASYSYESFYNSPNIYSTFNKKLGNHEFTVMAGFEQERIEYKSTYAKRWDLISDDVPSLNTATGRQEASGSLGHSATRSFFGRLNYIFKEKYLLELSMRRDGSSKFANNYRWGTFPSGSAAYIISKESFWDPVSKFVNMLKVRASYGALGNQDVANYLYIERLPIYTNLAYIMGNERPNFVGMAGLISPGLTWEKVNTSNIGIDAGFMKNRLNLSFDYFIRNTYDMLGPAESLPSVLGTAVPKSNNATLKTNGFEAVLDWKDNIKDFVYNVKLVFSDATSTITRYYNPQKLLTGAFYEGAQLGDIWGYTTTGLFQSEEEVKATDQSYLSGEVWRPGDVHYTDLNGDGKINIGKNTLADPGDLSIIGNSTPRYAYSLFLNAAWKGLDFAMLWQGIGKRDLMLGSGMFWGATGGQWFSLGLIEHMDYWTEENTDAYYPRPYLNKSNKNHQTQTRYLQNGAYLRMKSVQLGYTLPGILTQKVRIKNLRIFVSGENLLTFTKLIKIFDPEGTGGATGSGQLYPLQKFLSTGLSLTF